MDSSSQQSEQPSIITSKTGHKCAAHAAGFAHRAVQSSSHRPRHVHTTLHFASCQVMTPLKHAEEPASCRTY